MTALPFWLIAFPAAVLVLCAVAWLFEGTVAGRLFGNWLAALLGFGDVVR